MLDRNTFMTHEKKDFPKEGRQPFTANMVKYKKNQILLWN